MKDKLISIEEEGLNFSEIIEKEEILVIIA